MLGMAVDHLSVLFFSVMVKIIFLTLGLTMVSSVPSAYPAQPFVSIENVSRLYDVCFTHTRVQAVLKSSFGSEVKIYAIMFML